MKVIILGGGVAGVGTAIALRQQGVAVRVLERHRARSHIGAGIVVWPNASFVLDQLGVLPQMAAVAGRPVAMRRRSHEDEELGTLDIGLIDAIMGYPSLSVLRADFHDMLIARLEALGVQVEYGCEVMRIEDGKHGLADVHLSDGSVLGADAIVGADGRMASRARTYVLGDNTPVYQGFVNWIGVVESAELRFDEMQVSDYWGVGERFGIVPVGRHKAYWAGGIGTGIGARDPACYKDELNAVFAHWPQPVGGIIAATAPGRINKIYVHDHHPMPTWHRRNVIAIGDAAHASLPTSGQGACQALEDAWHLSRCLTDGPADVEAAFSAFTAIRLDKTTGVTMAGRGLASSLFSRDEAVCLARNDASKRSDFTAMAAAMARGWSQHLPLPQ